MSLASQSPAHKPHACPRNRSLSASQPPRSGSRAATPISLLLIWCGFWAGSKAYQSFSGLNDHTSPPTLAASTSQGSASSGYFQAKQITEAHKNARASEYVTTCTRRCVSVAGLFGSSFISFVHRAARLAGSGVSIYVHTAVQIAMARFSEPMPRGPAWLCLI